MGTCCICACVFKIVLGILNSVILLGGLLIAGVGGALIGISNGSLTLILQGFLYSILNNLNVVDKAALSNSQSTSFASMLHPTGIALVCVGCFIAGIAVLGYLGGSITIILKIYAIVLMVLVLVETILVATFFSGALSPYMKKYLNITLVDDYVNITDGGIFSMGWNVIMIQCGCCGLNDYTDFFYIDHSWPKNETININGKSETVELLTPVACCKTEGNYPGYKFVDDYCAVYPNDTTSNWKTGCWNRVSDLLNPYRQAGIAVCVLVLIVQAVIIAMACIIIQDSSSGNKVGP